MPDPTVSEYVHQNIGARRKVRPGPGRAARVAARNASSQRALETLLAHKPAAAAINEMGDVDVPAGWERYGGHGAVLWPTGTKTLATRTAPLSRAVANKRNARSWGHARSAYCVTFPGEKRPVTVIAGHLCPPRNLARDPRRQSIAANHAGQRNLAALIEHFRDAGHDVVCGADINVGWAKALPVLRQALTWQAVHGIDWLGATAIGHAKKLPNSGSDHPGQLLTVPVGAPAPTRPPKETPVARQARSLDQFLREVNAIAPGRNKATDGGIGDPAHAKRVSDHNPNRAGVWRARDTTDDPAHGMSGHKLAAALVSMYHDPDPHPAMRSGAYTIWRGRIYSYDRRNEGWRPNTGHEHHVHQSVATAASGYDSTKSWGLAQQMNSRAYKPGERDLSHRDERDPLEGADVRFVQQKVGAKVDGFYGPKTAARVKEWERKHNAELARAEAKSKPPRPAPRLKVDGTVGTRTWEALGVEPKYDAPKPGAKR